MKLSELVAYKNNLNRLTVAEAENKTDFDINKIKHLVGSKEVDTDHFKSLLDQKHQEINDKFREFENIVNQIAQTIEQQITLKEAYWQQESYRLYNQEMANDTPDYILSRKLQLSNEHEGIVRARIKNLSNHQHPGMIIRPGTETFINDMVSFDPLYLVDEHQDLLFPSMLGFPDQYRRRLRPYTVNERDLSTPILEKLPDGQFAICVAYNFFNFKPLEVIDRYLQEIFVKLKPGGRLLMTFNDCDNEKAVRLAESYYSCYTPGRLVRAIAQRIGYEIYFIWNDNTPQTWIELQRPGSLTTLRGGQALAKVVRYTE